MYLCFVEFVRYKVKLRVGDGDGNVVFVVFDGDMHNLLGKQCSDLVSAAKVYLKNPFFAYLLCICVLLHQL
jgi:hypothetical protein